MNIQVGIGGATRNTCVALGAGRRIAAACEQERLTRVRGAGLTPGTLPAEALDAVLALGRASRHDVRTFAVAEPGAQLPRELPITRLDHHLAHAATAFLTSPFERAAVLVCDSHPGRELSVWRADDTELTDLQWSWSGPAFATLYSECARLIAGPGAHAHDLEVIAHLGGADAAERAGHALPVFAWAGDRIELEPDWRERIATAAERERRERGRVAATARLVQDRLGALLIELVAAIRKAVDVDALCLGGGLFYNTWFNTRVATSGAFARTFVPINPGNAGLSVGAAMLAGDAPRSPEPRHPVSPFLGPEYDSEEIKAALDGCKLSYEFVTESQAIDAAVGALGRGQLVGWFQGRMEWGHRALGGRSILANPLSPYVLDNLNFFLRKRDRSRPFGLAVAEADAASLLCGPERAPFMEFEYRPRDDRFRHLLPPGASTLRAQTVGAGAAAFAVLLQRMGQATGTAAVVNTSFNGFHEPIVCSPRDAIRVFYGTGLDMLVIGRFILRK